MSSPFRTPDDSIEVVPHDPQWAAAFLSAKAEILAAAPEVAVEHMGSSSVPGLPSKPTLDILVTFLTGTDLARLIESLEAAGFEHRPTAFADEAEIHLFLRRVSPDRKRTHHLHVLESGSSRAADYLVFRDYLRAHPEARDAYAAEKLRLIGEGATRSEYVAEKSGIVVRLLADARRWASSRR